MLGQLQKKQACCHKSCLSSELFAVHEGCSMLPHVALRWTVLLTVEKVRIGGRPPSAISCRNQEQSLDRCNAGSLGLNISFWKVGEAASMLRLLAGFGLRQCQQQALPSNMKCSRTPTPVLQDWPQPPLSLKTCLSMQSSPCL